MVSDVVIIFNKFKKIKRLYTTLHYSFYSLSLLAIIHQSLRTHLSSVYYTFSTIS